MRDASWLDTGPIRGGTSTEIWTRRVGMHESFLATPACHRSEGVWHALFLQSLGLVSQT